MSLIELPEVLRNEVTRDLEAKAQKSSPTDPVTWIERNFWIPETRSTIPLMDYQKDCINHIFRLDERGYYPYSIVIWSDIKKSAKSTIAAAVAQWTAMNIDFAEIYIIANDLKQADSRVANYFRRSLELNPDMKGRYRQRGYKTIFDNGSFVEAIPIDPSGEAGSNADAIFWCLDQDTEVLTRDGWKRWDELRKGDPIATRNKTGEFEWQSAKGIYLNRYSGKMVGIKSGSMDALVTPNHRMYGYFFGGKYPAPDVQKAKTTVREFAMSHIPSFAEAENARLSTYYFPVFTSIWSGGEEYWHEIPATYKINGHGQIYGISQNAMRIHPRLFSEFMGWYLSEGCTIKKSGRIEGFCIAQSATANNNKRKRIKELLIAMGFSPKDWKMSLSVYHSEFGKYLAQFGLSGEKYIPDTIKNMPREYLQIFLDAYIDGDGTKKPNAGILISTKSKRMLDDLTEVSQKCGYSIKSAKRIDLRWKKKPIIYTLYLHANHKNYQRGQIGKKNWYETEYTGMVFCPSTENGVIYVRRNGTYYWTGNSELWGAHQEAQERMWTEMTLSPTKFGKSFRWVESYAGYAEESELLYSLYEQGVIQGEKVFDNDLEAYKNGRMFCLWNSVPRCPWQTQEYYDSEAAVLTPEEFNRMHKNMWASATEIFVPVEWWNACERPYPSPKKYEPQVIALDAGVSDDTFGLIVLARHPEDNESVVVRHAQNWKPPKGGKIDYQGTNENPGPEIFIQQYCKENNVVEIAYDPFQLEDMAGRLKRQGIAFCKSFPQGSQRLVADSELRSKIRDRRLWHNGNQTLTAHVRNANAQKDEKEDRKIRIVKRTQQLKIDLCVALSMGAHEVMRLNL